MSSIAGTRPGPQRPGGQPQPAPPGGKKEAAGLSLVSATALVIGSIIGTGVFTMPAVLAGAGTSGLVVLAVVGWVRCCWWCPVRGRVAAGAGGMIAR